jgi:hypothetical protein
MSFVLVYQYGAQRRNKTETFDTEPEAFVRACALIAQGDCRYLNVEDENGRTVTTESQIRSRCKATGNALILPVTDWKESCWHCHIAAHCRGAAQDERCTDARTFKVDRCRWELDSKMRSNGNESPQGCVIITSCNHSSDSAGFRSFPDQFWIFASQDCRYPPETAAEVPLPQVSFRGAPSNQPTRSGGQGQQELRRPRRPETGSCAVGRRGRPLAELCRQPGTVGRRR